MPVKVFELFNQLKRDHSDRKTQAMARRSRRGKKAKAFVSQPTPHVIGSAQKGLQLAAGNFLIEGQLIAEPDYSIWNVETGSTEFHINAHSFSWLDHFAANGSDLCISKSRAWFSDWVAIYGDGDNAAWVPELAGARIISMINHAFLLLGNSTEMDTEIYFLSISHHARFLKKRWQSAPNGLPKFHALVGYVYSAIALEEFFGDLKAAMHALARECDSYIAEDGGIPTRNPEELLDIFTLLVWVNQGLTSAAIHPSRSLLTAIERIAPAIRSLRLGDGKMVEFHEGRAANAQHIDQILSEYSEYSTSINSGTMGYMRMSNDGSVVVMDVGDSGFSHEDGQNCECALAFEFSSKAQTIVRSLGSGRDFGDIWRNVGLKSSGFSVASIPSVAQNDVNVSLLREENQFATASILEACNDGYLNTCGLRYIRMLELSSNGRVLFGSDRFFCEGGENNRVFDAEVNKRDADGIPIVLRFHVDADVEAELDLGGAAVSLQLPNNEIWIFKASAGVISLEDSIHFVSDRLKPRATKQIVVTSRVVNYEGAVNWMLTRIED